MLMFNNLIDGEWLSDGARAPNVNPSDTKDIVGEAVRGTRAQAEAAIAAAKAAFPAWSRSTPQVRYDILKKASDEILARKDELGRLLSREEGKTLPEGIGEVARAGQIFAFFAGECLRMAGEKLASVRPGIDIEITREALGVVGLITPWNFPIAIPAWKIAPALAYGNTVVIKPADLVPGSTWALVDILHRAGLPEGRAQPRDRARLRSRRRPARASRCRGDQLHGLGCHRPEGRCGLHRVAADEEVPARDGRQESAGRARRRGPEGRGGMRRQQRVLFHRASAAPPPRG